MSLFSEKRQGAFIRAGTVIRINTIFMVNTVTSYSAQIDYTNKFYFCEVYRCVNTGKSLMNSIRPEGLFVKFENDPSKSSTKNKICFL